MHKRPVGTIYLLKRAELAVRSCMDVALAALWNSAESNALHPGSIRAKAQELMREHIAISQRRGPRAVPERPRNGAVRPRR
jgi:hypothetical protein